MKGPRFLVLASLAAAVYAAASGPYDPKLFSELRWRPIGPFRGGRTKAAAGVPSQPNVFYIGVVQRRRLEDHRLRPHLDADLRRPADRLDRRHRRRALQPRHHLRRQRRGPAAARPLDRRRHLQVHRRRQDLDAPRPARRPADSADRRRPAQPRPAVRRRARPSLRPERRARHLPLDRRRPNLREGARTRTRTPAASDVVIDPANPDIVYAALWEARQGPWENGVLDRPGQRPLQVHRRRHHLEAADRRPALRRRRPRPGQHRHRAEQPAAPLRRASPSAGGSRHLPLRRRGRALGRASPPTRAPPARIGGGDLSVPAVDPKNPDIVYHRQHRHLEVDRRRQDLDRHSAARPAATTTSASGSTPTTPTSSCSSADQGAIVTVNGGADVELLVQPADRADLPRDHRQRVPVPRVRRPAGERLGLRRRAAATTAQITFREWHPVGVEEYGYVAPDPLDPDIVYGGKVTRYDRRTGQVPNVAPKPLRGARTIRALRTAPVLFSPADPHVLFFAANTLWKTTDGGRSWKQISPDLTRKTWEVPASVGKYRDPARPSPRSAASSTPSRRRPSTSTASGPAPTTASSTSPPTAASTWTGRDAAALGPWAKVSIIDAGHFDAHTAYAAINTLRLDDLRPHIFRTHDGGKTWTEIVNGIPDGAPVERRARGSQNARACSSPAPSAQVYVSFDDGDHWQSLRLNMPATPIRDLVDQGRRPGRRHARPRLLDSRRHHAAAAAQPGDRCRRAPSSSRRRPPSACAGT